MVQEHVFVAQDVQEKVERHLWEPDVVFVHRLEEILCGCESVNVDARTHERSFEVGHILVVNLENTDAFLDLLRPQTGEGAIANHPYALRSLTILLHIKSF